MKRAFLPRALSTLEPGDLCFTRDDHPTVMLVITGDGMGRHRTFDLDDGIMFIDDEKLYYEATWWYPLSRIRECKLGRPDGTIGSCQPEEST